MLTRMAEPRLWLPLPERAVRNGFLSSDRLPEDLVQFVISHLELQLLVQMEIRENRFSHRVAAVLTDDGQLFIASERDHGNPPQVGPAVVGALSAMVTSGRLRNALAVFVLDAKPASGEIVYPLEMAYLSQYLSPQANGQIRIAGKRFGSDTVVQLIKPAQDPSLLWEPSRTSVLTQLAQHDMGLVYELPEAFHPERPQPELMDAIFAEVLVPALGNSTCDGVHRPATKAHSAAMIRGKLLVVSVNTRHLDNPSMVICAETNATWLAAAMHWKSWGTGVCYSPHYYLTEGGSGFPKNCGVCLGIMGEYIDPALNNMRLCSFNAEGRWTSTWHSKLMKECFARNEGSIQRGKFLT